MCSRRAIAPCKYVIVSICHYSVDQDYRLEKQCEAGAVISNIAECKKACDTLGISRRGVFKEGRPCYKGGSGVCNQDVKRPGNKATKICKGLSKKTNVYLIFWERISISFRNKFPLMPFLPILQYFRHPKATLYTTSIMNTIPMCPHYWKS